MTLFKKLNEENNQAVFRTAQLFYSLALIKDHVIEKYLEKLQRWN